MKRKTKKEVLNMIVYDSCPDDMESWQGIVSFDVDSDVVDAKEAFKEAVEEYVSEQKKLNPPEEDDDVEPITWDKIYSHMPDELFVKYGLHRRRDVRNLIVSVNCDEEPDFDEEW